MFGGDDTIFQRGTGRYAREDGADGGAGAGIGVNAYLWRAALETIAFLPLTQADPFGGVIITDWHSPPETPDERFKLNVYILDTVLRADGLKVVVFRQTGGENRVARRQRRSADRDQDRGQHPDQGARAAHRRLGCQQLGPRSGCRRERASRPVRGWLELSARLP